MTTMLVWHNGQKPVRLFLVSGPQEEFVAKCNGQYINDRALPDDAPVRRLNDLLGGPEFQDITNMTRIESFIDDVIVTGLRP